MTTRPRMASTSPVFDRLYTLAEVATMTTRKRRQYELSLKNYWDLEADKDTTRNRMRKERAEGRTEGENKKAIAIAMNLLSMGMAAEQVATATGLSIEEVNKCK